MADAAISSYAPRGKSLTEGLVITVRLSALSRKAWMLFAGALFYGALVACYGLTIVPTNFSEGFTYRDLPAWCWVTSLVLALMPLLWMQPDFRRPSDFTSWFLYACVTVPVMFIPLLASTDDPEDVLPLMLMVLLAQLLFDWSRRGRTVRVPRVSGSLPMFMIAMPILMVGLSLALWSHVGFRIDLGIEDVYVRREEAREALNSGAANLVLRYGEAVLLGVLIPSATVLGISKRKPHMLAAAAFSVLAVFSFDGQKAVLLGPIMLALVTILTSRTRRNGFFWMTGAFACLFLLAIGQVFVLSNSSLSIYVVRRVTAMPGLLSYFYWEFFSQNPHVMLRDGALGSVFSRSPYPFGAARMIGLEYFGSPDTNANAGIWLAGFAHFGYAGAMIASVLAGWILRLVDSMALQGRYAAGCAFCMMLGLIWSNGALHTSLLSNGVVVLLGTLMIFPTLTEANGRQNRGEAGAV